MLSIGRFMRLCCMSLCKLFQRRTLDTLSRKNFLCLFFLFALVLLPLLFYGEVLKDSWNQRRINKHEDSDNIGGAPFSARLCSPSPVDAVYTWVNGSDPRHERILHKWIQKVNQIGDRNETDDVTISEEIECPKEAECVKTSVVVVRPFLSSRPSASNLSSSLQINASLIRDVVHSFDGVSRTNSASAIVLRGDNHDVEHVISKAKGASPSLSNHSIEIGRLLLSGGDEETFNHHLMTSWIVVSGYPRHFVSGDEVTQVLPQSSKIKEKQFYFVEGFLLLKFEAETEAKDFMKQLNNVTIAGKSLSSSHPRLLLSPPRRRLLVEDDAAPSRYQDNDELRFSLRSLDKNAPWIRRIFIVTNGQIPSWLNLEHPRVSLVTHSQIFAAANVTQHLPTFSSPAIEAHIHHIPGLSEKFIYLNDDVLFGLPVWPDDFFTHGGGQKVFLSWPVPACREGCPQTWIKDSYCDKACNTSDCDWDGGDCLGNQRVNHFGAHFNLDSPLLGGGGRQGFPAHHGFSGESSMPYCHQGCANNWLADRYCDSTCNFASCGFDAGDCGVEKLMELPTPTIQLLTLVHDYYIPEGVEAIALNFTQVLPSLSHTVIEVSYDVDQDEAVRVVSVAMQFKLIFVIYYARRTNASLSIELKIAEPQKLNETLTKPATQTHEQPRDIRHVQLIHTEDSPEHKGPFTTFTFNLTMTSSPPQSHLHSEVSDIKNSNNNNSISLVNFAQTSSSSTEHFEDLDPYSAVPLSSLYPRNLDPNSSLADFQSAFSNESLVQIQAFLDANHSWVESSTNETSTFPLWNMTSIVLPPGVREAVMSLKKDFDGGILSGKGFRWKLWKLWTTLNSEGVVMGSATRGERHGFVSTKLDVAASTLGTEIPTTVESHVEIQDFPGDKLTGRRRRRSLMGRRRLLETSSWTRRRLLDTYADSLRHTNRVLNRAFGYVARKVPAHMPHMAQKSVLHNFQKRFPEEIRETSSHRFRSPNDLQFSFAYFYYLMSEMKNVSSIVEGYFAELDINKDEVLSDREIRILAVKILPTPLTGESLESMENILINCSSVETKDPHPNTKTPSVKYYNPKMPLITRQLFLNCSILMEKLQKHFEAEKKTNWHFEIVGEDDVAFKMLNSNASEVVKKLDDIRKHPKKFICLNDNLDHESKEAKIVKMLIHDFYESFFPFPSQFELQSGLRNKFTHVWELKQWEEKRENAEVYVFVALVILLMIAVGSFVYDNCRCWRGGRNQSDRV